MRAGIVVVVVAILASGCAAKRNAKFSEPCSSGDDCESGLCYDGHCSKSCVTHEDCGSKGVLCVEKVCHWPSAACDDGDLCTEADGIVSGKCQAGRTVHCSDDELCRTWDCDAKKGCFSTARNVDAPCTVTATTGPGLCAAGGTDTNGCRCALWQGKVWGPGDEGKNIVHNGVPEKFKTKDVANSAFGAAVAGSGVVVVGASGDKGWAARVSGTGQVPWTRSYEAAASSGGGDQALLDVAALAGGGFLAVGHRAQSAAWFLRLDSDGNPMASEVAPALGNAAVSVAAVAGGVYLALVRQVVFDFQEAISLAVRLEDNAKIAGTPQKLSAPNGGTVVAVDLAAQGTRTVAVGYAQVNGSRQAWAARLGADGTQQASVLLLPNGVTETELRGVAIAPDGTTAAFGWGRWVGETNKRAWFVRLDDSLAIIGGKGAFVGLGEKSGALLGAGVQLATGAWLLLGERDGLPGNGLPGAVQWTPAGVTSFPIGTAATGLVAAIRSGDAVVLVGLAKTASEADAWLMRTNAQGLDGCK